ncbi:MAG: DUF4190 domain-containing protein [Phycisphaerales bacterium JB040]
MNHGATTDGMFEDQKTSLSAIIGFVLSLVGCCLPTGILGVVLGVFGLIGIGRSGGRVGGKGLAIAAIIIGVLNTVVQIGLVIGLVQWGRSAAQFGDRAGAFLTALEQGDYDEARGWLAGSVSGAGDAELTAFSDAVQEDLGTFVSTPDSILSLFGGWLEFGQQMQQHQIPMAVPVVLTFEQDRAMMLYAWNPQNTGTPMPPMTDLRIVLRDGTAITLSDFVAGAPPAGDAPATGDRPSEQSPENAPEEPGDAGEDSGSDTGGG